MKWWPAECKPGDMIRVRLGSIYHYGVFVSDGEVIQFGMPPVPQYATGGEIVVCRSGIDEFSCGNIVEVAVFDRKEAKIRIPPEKTIEIAESRLGEGGYDLLHNNCEHFAYECVLGVKRSEQEENARKRWASRKILCVFVSDIPDGVGIEKVFPESRNREIETCRNERLKAARYVDWKLLGYAAKRVFACDTDTLRFKKKRSGKWECDKFFFSLSHTDTSVAVAVSNSRCGVDIENLGRGQMYGKETLEKMMKHAFTEEERARAQESIVEFLKIWTAKESIFKASGDNNFFPQKTDTSSQKTSTFVFGDEDIVLSVCGENSESARIVFVEMRDGSFFEKTPSGRV